MNNQCSLNFSSLLLSPGSWLTVLTHCAAPAADSRLLLPHTSPSVSFLVLKGGNGGQQGPFSTKTHPADPDIHPLCLRSLMATREALHEERAMLAWLKDRQHQVRRQNNILGRSNSPENKRRIPCWAPSQNASKSEHRTHSRNEL